MLDTKSKLILKILAQECGNGNYKIVEISDIVLSLPKHYRMDHEAAKHILTYLERQDMISIKYDDDNMYCLTVLPYGFEILENENPIKSKTKKRDKSSKTSFREFFAAFLGAILGSVLAYFLYQFL